MHLCVYVCGVRMCVRCKVACACMCVHVSGVEGAWRLGTEVQALEPYGLDVAGGREVASTPQLCAPGGVSTGLGLCTLHLKAGRSKAVRSLCSRQQSQIVGINGAPRCEQRGYSFGPARARGSATITCLRQRLQGRQRNGRCHGEQRASGELSGGCWPGEAGDGYQNGAPFCFLGDG